MATTFPTWTDKRRTMPQIVALDTFKLMHPTMQQRIKDLLTAGGGRVGFGDGWRSKDLQRQIFLARYAQDPNGATFWNGKRWRHVSGHVLAPPGRSMHEIGLASDLTGDLDWVVKNCSAFGLKHFRDVNDEPHHVQPVELPNGRLDYERAGAPWAKKDDVPFVARPVGTTKTPPEVVPGAVGPHVEQLQAVMIRLGLIRDTPGNRDGRYLAATQKVIKGFQLAHGLRDDAKVGPKTWGVLLSLDPIGSRPGT
jgi:Putative peptidoglycan binding domain/D-alanyl-D-alanine carboxypeptidase